MNAFHKSLVVGSICLSSTCLLGATITGCTPEARTAAGVSVGLGKDAVCGALSFIPGVSAWEIKACEGLAGIIEAALLENGIKPDPVDTSATRGLVHLVALYADDGTLLGYGPESVRKHTDPKTGNPRVVASIRQKLNKVRGHM